MTITWDNIPGDSATQLSDAEMVLDRITTVINNETEDYDLLDLHSDLNELFDLIGRALRAVGGVL